MIDRERLRLGDEMRHLRQRHGTAGTALQKYLGQILRLRQKPRLDLEDHLALVSRGIDGLDLRLPERILQRGVDFRHVHAEPVGGAAIDNHVQVRRSDFEV